MDTLELGKKYSRYYARKASRDLCSLPKTKIRPDFEFGEDDASWTGTNPRNPHKRLIHLGLKSFANFPDGTPVCTSENEWHCNIRHVLTHEEGHVFHTTERAWIMVHQNGVKDIIAYCYEKKTGVKLFARTDEQYDAAVCDLYKSYNMLINMEIVKQFVHMIANSIEDGRMERRMAASRPGFKADLRACRGKRWLHSPVALDSNKAPDYSNPSNLLIGVCNQILSFATMGIWQRGYMQYVRGTKVEEEVQKLLPEIRAGVTARSCKAGMVHAGNIIRALCPLFYDACTIQDFPKELQELLEQLASAMPDLGKDGNGKTEYNADESSEEQMESDPGEGAYQLSDDTGDGAGSSETKVVFNIFADEDEDEALSHSAGGNGKSDKSNGAEDAEKQGTASSGESGEGGANGNATSAKAGATPDAPAASYGGDSGSKGQDATGFQDGDVEKIEQAMKDAVQQANAESGYTKRAVQRTESVQKKPVYDTRSVLQDVDVSKICTNFHEYFRAYKLTEDLPVSIEQESLVIRRKYEEYFQSRRKPAQRGQRSGRLDPRSLTRVVTKSLDVFNLPAEDHSFSGCIEMLVDRSGSMSGWKMKQAMEICAMLEEIFSGLLPLKIVAFDMSGGVNVEVIKNWNDDLPKNGCWNFLKYERAGGGTPTKETLLIAEEELLTRAEKHKLIVLITDENCYCANSALQNAIRHVRSKGIQLSAFYIETRMPEASIRSFKELFDNMDALATTPDHLAEEMLPVIKKFTHQN